MEHGPATAVVVKVRPDGTIEVPAAKVQGMGFRPGDRVRVGVRDAALSRRLRGLGVTDEEIETIVTMQLESPEQVAQFLAAEGALASRVSFRKRVQAWKR